MYKNCRIIFLLLAFVCSQNFVLKAQETCSPQYLLLYWFKTDFSSPDFKIEDPDFYEYARRLSLLPEDQSKLIIKDLIKKSSKNKVALKSVFNLCDKFLYNANSPVRNEEIYAAALESIIASDLSDDEKILPAYQLETINKNRKGTVATDFLFTPHEGKKQRLHEIDSEYTLLFFNNPDCSSCIEIKKALDAFEPLSKMIKDGKITVLAVYTDKDLRKWRKHAANFNPAWIYSYSDTYKKYDLLAIPTIYLLNRNKKVLLKDPFLEDFKAYILTLEK